MTSVGMQRRTSRSSVSRMTTPTIIPIHDANQTAKQPATKPVGVPMTGKPSWLKVRAPMSREYRQLVELMRGQKLNTVCEEASCPNIGECWKHGSATFMILGRVCTRTCAFCDVETGKPDAVDHDEPKHLADAAAAMGLKHVVITSVDRDDLADGGAAHYAATIYAVREKLPAATIEVLTPDFQRKPPACLDTLMAAHP
ncbi:MAG: lipoyl synthase, partial [Mariprofundaceae bacterium]|nr:lipoyl synthase [Mariprofundaceae bacterium]